MTEIKENIERSLDLMYKVEGKPSKQKVLLDKPKTVLLQIGLFKVPFVPAPTKKFVKLRHSLHGDDPEICLFVPNRKTGLEYKISTDEMIDSCIDYYTELLEKHKIKGITTVMPLKQLRSEYGTFEMRRKLVRRYDLFLCKNSLLYNPRFLTALGKIFKVVNREPLGVSFPKPDSDYDPEFQKNIDKAIFTSTFNIRRFSDNYGIPVGTLEMTKSKLKENIETVLDQLIDGKMIPGGIKNVRVMYLLPCKSKAVPLFFNPEIPCKEGRPKLKSGKKRKLPVGVEGELSTQPGKKVVVMPNGEVFVTRIEAKKEIEEEEEENESESDGSFVDGSEDEEERKEEKLKMKTQKDEEESESEDDEEIEEREQRLLREKRKAESSINGKSNKSNEEEDEEENNDVSEEEESMNGGLISKKARSKGKKGKNVTKSNRKLLMKQEKFKAKEKIKQKRKNKKNV